MIDFLSSWVKNLSLALIIVSILEMLLPNSKTKKYIKMIMGIYILFNIISPFINSSNFRLESINLDTYETYAEETSEIKVDQTSMYVRLGEIYGEQLEKDIIGKLEEKGYEVEKCKVTAKISQENNESTIEKIVLKLKIKQSNEVEQETKRSDSSFEDRIVTEIENIKKVEIKVSENSEYVESNEQEGTALTKSDIETVKKFLIEEYGVNEKCLKIS